MAASATAYWKNRRGRSPAIVAELQRAANAQTYSTSGILALIERLRESVRKSGGSGVLLVIDELGKFLEYEARHAEVNDIFLLQAIAEHAARKYEIPLQLVVLLHQSFDQYARGLGERLRNEWQKVQGRFEAVPFLESTEQVLRVVKASIRQDLPPPIMQRVSRESNRIANELSKAGALPGALGVATAGELFTACYPLHPISLLLLPVLCQRVAQNERTLFSYLGSHESHGFNDSLARLEASSEKIDWIFPWEIYEYFVRNQPTAVSDLTTHRRWAEVVTALERLGDAQDSERHLLETIGLLNIVGAQGGLKASRSLLELCLAKTSPDSDSPSRLLQALTEKSLITYRKFGDEFRVWQGSDFDLGAAVTREIAQMVDLDVSGLLNERQPLPPVVARRHSAETGALRYFVPTFVDEATLVNVTTGTVTPIISILLARSDEEEKKLLSVVAQGTGSLMFVAICRNGIQIQDAVRERVALERVQRGSQELASDPVAQRELKDRLNTAIQIESELLTGIFEEPERSHWIYDKHAVRIERKRDLQDKLSDILDRVYDATPRIANELVNRDKLSSSAAAARNKLFEHMLKRSFEPDLGIQKYPPEKAIYRSVLLATGLHRKEGGSWSFAPPSTRRDASRIAPMWRAIEKYFERSEEKPLPVSVLFAELTRPPFGVKAGMLPILFLSACLSREHEVALFEAGVFLPGISIEVLARLVRDPSSFAVQRFKIAGIRTTIYEQYLEIVTGEKRSSPGTLQIARPLARFMMQLPDYSKRTRNISKEAQGVRDAFFAAKSPAQLLLADIPRACGHAPFLNNSKEGARVAEFVRVLLGVLNEIRGAYPALLESFQKKLVSAFPDCRVQKLAEARSKLAGRCTGLDKYTIDTEGLKAFIGRLSDGSGTDIQWLESVATFLARKPPEKWNDEDSVFVDYRLAEFSRGLRDLEKLRLAYEDGQNRLDPDFEAMLVRIIRQGNGDKEYLVHIDQDRRQLLDRVIPVIQRELEKLPDVRQRLAATAVLLNELMGSVDRSDNLSSKAQIKGRR